MSSKRLPRSTFTPFALLLMPFGQAVAHEPTHLHCKDTVFSERWIKVVVHVAQPGDSYNTGIAWSPDYGGTFVGENITHTDQIYHASGRALLMFWDLFINRVTGEANLFLSNQIQPNTYVCAPQTPKF